MDRYLSPYLFAADPSTGDAAAEPTLELATARELNFKESWLRDAIAASPEIVIAPCREAGLTDEAWTCWTREFHLESAGNIDILLISESGRVAIVETKLSYNPEGRRSVVAQTLEYAIHLPAVEEARLPTIPQVNGRAFVEREAVLARIQEGDYLLIVTGDRLDSRAVKLGKALLGRHLINTWEFALVEVAVFRNRMDVGSRNCLLVPYLRGAIIPEQRQVVRIVIEGDRARVDVQPTTPVAVDAPRQKQSEMDFFASLPAGLTTIAEGLRALRERYPTVSLGYGSSSLILRHRNANILEFYADGRVRFRPSFFEQALGQTVAHEYHEKLKALFPAAMQMSYPSEKLDHRKSQQLLTVIEEVLREANGSTSGEAER